MAGDTLLCFGFTALRTERRGSGVGVTHRVAGDRERFVAGRRGRRVFDLSAQELHPVLQVLLVGANHLQTVKHRACKSRDGGDESAVRS